MSVLKHVVRRAAVERLEDLRHQAAFPLLPQEQTLASLMRRARSTRFGRDHGLARVKTHADLKAAVPLRDYRAYAPWLDAARAGEPDVVWPGRIRYWAISSGTTSGEKYLPISRDTIRTNRAGGCDALVPFAAQTRQDLFAGRLLFLGGSTTLRRQGSAWIGDCTGIMTKHLPSLLRLWHTPGPAIASLGDWGEKIRRAAEVAVGQDVRMLSGVPSWILLFAEEVLAEARRRGKTAECLLDVWPHLALYVHGGMAFAPYRQRFLEVVGGPIWCTDTFSASEGGMLAVQDRPHDPGMLPIVDQGVFLELVPREEVSSPSPTRLGLHEVEPDVDYAVVLHTDSGLFGYVVGDLVRFTGTQPRRLVFAGRIAHTLNAFGEHVSGAELDRAVVAAAAATEARVAEFAVATEYPDRGRPVGRHVWYVEFERAPDRLEDFALAVDRGIAAGNEDYAAHRAGDFGLAPPGVRALPPGAFYGWMRARERFGGQNKVPRVLSPELEGDLVAHLGRPDAPPAVATAPRETRARDAGEPARR
jgi:hypothetical protein